MTRTPVTLAATLAVTVALSLAAASAGAQTIGTNSAPNQPQGFTLSVQSQLVIEAVTVKDKQGNFVHGLTAKEFALTEDGVPQTIRYCEPESLAQNAKFLPEEAPQDDNITIYNRLAREQIQAESIVLSAQSRLGTMPLNFNLDVSTLPPGKYDCQVTVLDPTAQKANFWRAPIELVP